MKNDFSLQINLINLTNKQTLKQTVWCLTIILIMMFKRLIFWWLWELMKQLITHISFHIHRSHMYCFEYNTLEDNTEALRLIVSEVWKIDIITINVKNLPV